MVLKNGSSGAVVKLLQEKLGIKADGDFGPGTEAKLKEWQKKNGLEVDGIAGSDTLTAMGIIEKEHPSFIEKLKGFIPDNVYAQLGNVQMNFGMNTSLRACHFLSQCAHESSNFKNVSENLKYSSSGLKRTFSKYFPGNLSESYAFKDTEIGSRVYANRMGNGDESSREGFKFRGRGYIQLTGKNNYTNFSKFIGEDVVSNPDLVSTKYPLVSAAYFFTRSGIWAICDEGSSTDVITEVTLRINGGKIGLSDRIDKFSKYAKILL
jgi:putative chitinase